MNVTSGHWSIQPAGRAVPGPGAVAAVVASRLFLFYSMKVGLYRKYAFSCGGGGCC